MSTSEIIRVITQGKVILTKLTIPEGYTALQIGHYFERKRICNSSEFMRLIQDRDFLRSMQINADSAEGYLYPSTYMVPLNVDVKTIVELMIKKFKSTIATLGNFENTLDFEKTIILASILEAETKVESELPIIAGVYLNRLKKRLPLQADATVRYIKMPKIIELRDQIRELKDTLKTENDPNVKKKIEKDITRLTRLATVVTYKDLRIDNPYNTYIYTGFPPGPICNPGVKALAAAFKPAKTEYMFYVWNERTQKHVFSKDYRSHVGRIREVRRNQ